MTDLTIWSIHYDLYGGESYTFDMTGRKLTVQPDMAKAEWWWTVRWAGNKEKFDKKKGEVISARPVIKAWGKAPSKAEAMDAAMARARKARPRFAGDAGEVEDTLSL